jgi:bifunctional non-homologous end joining protein LigD
VPSGNRWIHEVKFDGYRVQVHLANTAVKIFTRRGNDWTNRFKKIAGDAWHINAGSAIIDGEVIVPSENGVSDFSVLQNELHGKSSKLFLYAFDLLYLNGFDLRKAPLLERKALLHKMIAKTDILFSESFEIDGATMFKQACRMGSRASFRRFATAVTIPDAATIGSRRHPGSAKRCLSQVSPSRRTNSTGSISGGLRAKI